MRRCTNDDPKHHLRDVHRFVEGHQHWPLGLCERLAALRSSYLVRLQFEHLWLLYRRANANRQNWRTVVIFGKYKELTDQEGRKAAHDLLAKSVSWWEPGYSKTVIEGKTRPLEPIYFRISIDKMTGHQALSHRNSL
jgi:nitroimidazol reductase NimA-like FMN-containing flavoprotein (pyridoxamine 5'-phosphate oxidase superfamily)